MWINVYVYESPKVQKLRDKNLWIKAHKYNNTYDHIIYKWINTHKAQIIIFSFLVGE